MLKVICSHTRIAKPGASASLFPTTFPRPQTWIQPLHPAKRHFFFSTIMASKRKVVVLGAGFGGLTLMNELGEASAEGKIDVSCFSGSNLFQLNNTVYTYQLFLSIIVFHAAYSNRIQ